MDIGEALAATRDVRVHFFEWLAWAEVAPPFSGGVIDEWPARMAAALRFAKSEWAAVVEYLKAQHERKEVRGD